MSRLSREKKREQKQAAHAATPAAPIDVHVPGAGHGAGPGAGSGAGAVGGSDGASVGGVPVFAAPGEEIHKAVLNRLHHIALATGHAVLATIHDERIGYVVPLQVDPDGSSHFTAEPVRTTPPEDAVAGRPPEPPTAGAATKPPTAGAATKPPMAGAATDPPMAGAATQWPPAGAAAVPPAAGPATDPPMAGAATEWPPAGAVPEPPVVGPATELPTPGPATEWPEAGAAAEPPLPEPGPMPPAAEQEPPRSDSATHVLRPVPGSGDLGAAPTFPLRAVPDPPQPTPEDTPPGPAAPPGTVAPPTGEFGPPPPMDVRPLPVPEAGPPAEPRRSRKPDPVLEAELLTDLDAKPTPARGFDAVAEAMFGDEAPGAQGDSGAPALVAEPITRINEAVKEGRIDAAAGLAEQTVAQASATLGPEHPEVLRLGELSAYIAYLAGDPLRAFRLSLDLAGARRRTGDAEAAYGNVQSAATAWRAVRDPALGLELGRDLIGLWTELAAEDGPAAEEIEQLESARARMGRLTERARNQEG
ncbi:MULTISPECIES: tetratricopeptide repeat protein [Streptomyces]|uniref:tetratricopeptide repeat protein n=1 Tax=Streptomyces TaxID=1883 RepID=UPI00287FA5E7|nr:tetratricopeptide repeat protein [Streptomyces sp. CGMCC 4.1456]WNF64371.1 tetratricopeptide repeat protein [Streptomyces sp. CGMCC 4.1456]